MLLALMHNWFSALLAIIGGVIACTVLRYFIATLSKSNECVIRSRPICIFMYTSLVWCSIYIVLVCSDHYAIWLIYTWLSLLLVYIDCQFLLLPRVIVWLLGILGVFYQYVCLHTAWNYIVISALSSYLAMAFFYYSYIWLTRNTGMGYGDVRLTVALGIWVGYEYLPWLLMLAAIFALMYTAIFSLVSRRLLRICPFGPFLCLSSTIILIYNATRL